MTVFAFTQYLPSSKIECYVFAFYLIRTVNINKHKGELSYVNEARSIKTLRREFGVNEHEWPSKREIVSL